MIEDRGKGTEYIVYSIEARKQVKLDRTEHTDHSKENSSQRTDDRADGRGRWTGGERGSESQGIGQRTREQRPGDRTGHT